MWSQEEFEDRAAPRGIVGFREHVFTHNTSSLAEFMSQQELAFVTATQRALHRPLNVRFHYGHPDMFDKISVMTLGGMAKASLGINLSEDVSPTSPSAPCALPHFTSSRFSLSLV